jgi:hypothetical protein
MVGNDNLIATAASGTASLDAQSLNATRQFWQATQKQFMVVRTQVTTCHE